MAKNNEWQTEFSSCSEFRQICANQGVDTPFQTELEVLGEPVVLGEKTAQNSLSILPMEGCDGEADGRPGD